MAKGRVSFVHRTKNRQKRKGVHSKKASVGQKGYRKKYRGQCR